MFPMGSSSSIFEPHCNDWQNGASLGAFCCRLAALIGKQNSNQCRHPQDR